MFKSLALPNIFFHPQVRVSRPLPSQLARRKLPARPAGQGRLWLSYFLVGTGVALFFWHLLGINASATKGYEMKQIQTSIAGLLEENKKLSINLSEKYSVAGIQEDFARTNFVPAGQAQYIEINQLSKK